MPEMPKFSIIIPTRNRATTLKWALRTCLDSDHPNFEVVISDNDSSDDTAAVVAAFGDARIRYVRTPAFLSMSRNFDNGLKHAKGEFLIFIGDDDGILPFGLRALEAIFQKQPDLDLIDWALNPFLWPHTPKAQLTLNWLSNLRGPEIETAEQAWYRINHPRSSHYNDLNGFNIYHGCIRRKLFDLAEAAGAPLFDLPIPDIGAGTRVLRFAKMKLRLDVAITINGTSNMSTGWAHHTLRPDEKQRQIQADFHAQTAAEYPNSVIARFSRNRLNLFLGSLIDEHLGRRGDLTLLNLQPWRMILIEHLLRFPEAEMRPPLAEVNAMFAWCGENGAANAAPLSESDINFYRRPRLRPPVFFGQPFRFSPATLAAASTEPGVPRVRIADPRIVSMTQRANDIMMTVESAGDEFTIHDYVQLTNSLMRCDPFDPANLLVDDPAVFRTKVVLNVLGHLAADA